jgi:hypothetical protein
VFIIKLIAIISMAIDHVGLFFFPEQELFRIVGRVSFPLFAWLIANGAHHTKDINKYILRIFIFALISQIPFFLAFSQLGIDDIGLNVFFTLGLGLASIILIQKKLNKLFTIFSIFLLVLLAEFMKVDYGAYGILATVLFYVFYKNLKLMVVSQIVLTIIFTIFMALEGKSTIYLFGLFSLFFISICNGKKGPGAKYLFYAFYPLHFLVLNIIKITG